VGDMSGGIMSHSFLYDV